MDGCIAARQRVEQSTFSQEFQIEKRIGKELFWLLLYSMLYTGCFVGMHTLFSFMGAVKRVCQWRF